ncbi:MAG: hypothetical protein AAGF45_06440 [Pseudomonadota bacterium]
MSNGTFNAFLDALLAFESGWDRERYEAGIIADWQLDQWAGGPVANFFPQYDSWSNLSDTEWDTMAYRSMNTLGFVGYQFGEALLIDLGYYDDTLYYGNGAASNTWDGTWTGKNGATSLEAFMTKEVQDQAILDAFGYNLQIINNGLAQSGQSLDDFVGQTGSYVQNGQTVAVELTLTGILAAAHLRGAFGTLSLLQSGAVSADEFGTSILQYIEEFGGYDAPSATALIAAYNDGLTGDEGLGTPGDAGADDGAPGNTGGDSGTGSADVDASSADVIITWAWGTDTVVSDFDPGSSTIFVDWISADQIDVTQIPQGVLISVPGNDQTTLLQGVSLADLSADNFTFKDTSAAQKVLALVGDADGSGPVEPPGGDSSDDNNPPDDSDPPDGGNPPEDNNPPDEGDQNPEPPVETGGESQTVSITWNWANSALIDDFDPERDIIDFGNVGPSQLGLSVASDGDVVIEVLNNGGQSYRFDGVRAEDLQRDNFDAADWNQGAITAALSDLESLI